MKQVELAKQLGISKSYLSMILSGQRKCPEDLMKRLRATTGVHRTVNNQLWLRTGSQKVVGSNPISSTKRHFCKTRLLLPIILFGQIQSATYLPRLQIL